MFSEIQPHLVPARILLVRRTGGISSLIREVTTSKYSHVALVADSMDVAIVIEATMDVLGVAARRIQVITEDPAVEHLALLDLASEDGLEDYQRRLICQAAWLQTGEAYSNLVNLDIFNHIPVDHPFTRQSVNCALMVARAWKAIGLTTIDVSRPTPQAFAETPLLKTVWSSA